MVLLTPLGVLGIVVALALVLGLTFLPPVCAVIALLNGRYAVGLASAALWLAWLRLGGPVRGFVFEGFEHASL